MRTIVIVLSGILFTFSTLGAANDSSAEERYRIKSGRYPESAQGIEEQNKAAKRTESGHNRTSACCRYMNNSFKSENADPASFEARYRAKYGRATALAEARDNEARELAQEHVRRCLKLGKCTRMSAHAAEHVSHGGLVESAGRVHCDHECCKHRG